MIRLDVFFALFMMFAGGRAVFAQDWSWREDDLVLNPSGLELEGATSWAWGDLDRDGQPDVVVRKNGELHAFRGLLTVEPPYWVQAGDLLEGLNEPQLSQGVVLADLNSDQILDLLTRVKASGTETWHLLCWKRDELGIWRPDQSIFQGIDLSQNGFPNDPAFADVDGDGDLDLVIGEEISFSAGDKLRFFENIGSAGEPVWQEDSTRVEQANRNLAGFRNWSPTLIKLDSDNLFDLLLVFEIESSAGIAFYPGIEGSAGVHWVEPDFDTFTTGFDGLAGKILALDFEQDGREELVVLEATGTGRIYPVDESGRFGDFFRMGPIKFSSRASALPFDHAQDNTLDLLAAGRLPTFQGYEILFESYSKMAFAGRSFWKQTGWLNRPSGFFSENQVKVQLLDLDRNSRTNLIISPMDARPPRIGLLAYENPNLELANDWIVRNDLVSPFFYEDGSAPDVGFFEPSFGDLDNDGDADLLVQQRNFAGPDSGKAQYRFFENRLDPDAGWTARPEWRSGFQDTVFHQGNFGDLDADGDLDLVFGTEAGALLLYQNVGTATAPQWRPEQEALAGIQVGRFASPSVGDLSGDGTPDLLVGDHDGKLSFYRNETIVAVNDKPTVTPESFTLFPNYPNPFNPETTIAYQLSEPGRVTLAIYNVLGQRVRILVDAWRPAGLFTVSWDGKDESGLGATSGVYFYELRSNAEAVRRKLALIR